MNSEVIWTNCLDGVVEHVSPQHFATWFRPIKVVGGAEGAIELEVPNRFFLEWIKEHYLPLIQEVLRRVGKKDYKLNWRISDEASAVAAPAAKKSSKDTGAKAQKPAGLNLNPRYTFDNFVIGKANEFAHAACSSVASNPASKYNPLFIYGGVGLGKTHLLQAIGHKVQLNNPAAKVCYYTSERFMNDFINYISRQKMADFRVKFRNVDVLLIDDIQFWAGKERTQEEFFHTFNALYEAHKQIVVTSDKFPKDIDGLEERLRSRFEWGLVADIQPPDTETKIAILRKKAKAENVKIPDDVAGWLATVSDSNVRELEGFLNRIIAVSSLTNQEITLGMSKDALKNLLKEKEEKILTIDEIQKSVAVFFNIKFSDLRSKRRHRTIALPRQIAMYLAREYGNFSFPEIGSSFGGKDHSTAIHAVKKIEKELKENPEIKNAVKALKQNLGISK
ncbi:MAG: chromosomal replication initiator protein DnaA [Deltaproteobacteria bacterium]|nr:chromosomal replication initiator protein DnaA [Deltaproteobacteria bacterium]